MANNTHTNNTNNTNNTMTNNTNINTMTTNTTMTTNNNTHKDTTMTTNTMTNTNVIEASHRFAPSLTTPTFTLGQIVGILQFSNLKLQSESEGAYSYLRTFETISLSVEVTQYEEVTADATEYTNVVFIGAKDGSWYGDFFGTEADEIVRVIDSETDLSVPEPIEEDHVQVINELHQSMNITFLDEGTSSYQVFVETKTFKLELRHLEVVDDESTTYFVVVQVESRDGSWYDQYTGELADKVSSVVREKMLA